MVRFAVNSLHTPGVWVISQTDGPSLLHSNAQQSLTLDAALVYLELQCKFHRLAWQVEIREPEKPVRVWTLVGTDHAAEVPGITIPEREDSQSPGCG